MSFQAYLDNVEAKTGKTPQQFIDEAKAKNLTQHKELLAWLKGEYKLGHGHANAIIHVIKHGDKINPNHVGSKGVHQDEADTLKLSGKYK